MNSRNNIFHYNRRRAYISLLCSVTMASFVFVGLVIRLLGLSGTYVTPGIQAFRMFTVNSNLVVAVCYILCIPYEIDGIRSGNYHIPRWIVYTLYLGTTVVAITLVIAVAVLSPVEGFYAMLIEGSNLFYHFTCPLIAVILFMFVNCDHTIKFRFTWVAMAPIFLYAIVYAIMVFAIGEENGGWFDHYRFNAYLPWPVTCVIMLSAAFLIATGLRVVHNKMHKRQKRNAAKAYQDAKEFQCATIEEAIAILAADDKTRDPGDNNITIPRRIIRVLEQKYQSGKNLSELSEIYLRTYLA